MASVSSLMTSLVAGWPASGWEIEPDYTDLPVTVTGGVEFDVTRGVSLAEIWIRSTGGAVNSIVGDTVAFNVSMPSVDGYGRSRFWWILQGGSRYIQFDLTGSSSDGSDTNLNSFIGVSNVAVPYDPVAHANWRVRETAGTVYMETSPDGVTWTTQNSDTTTGDDATLALSIDTFTRTTGDHIELTLAAAGGSEPPDVQAIEGVVFAFADSTLEPSPVWTRIDD